jgi:hypothetical protein
VIARQRVPLVIFWTVSLLALNLFVFNVNHRFLRAEISEYIEGYLQTTLDDSLFGDSQGVVNDRSSLLDVGERINRALDRLILDRWYAALDDCRIAVDAIDDVSIRSDVRLDHTILVSLRRNASNRPVVVNYTCKHAVWPYVLWTATAIVLFALLYRSLPYPLSARQQRRHELLVAQGYDTDYAMYLVTECARTYERLTSRQQAALARLHSPENRNYEQALRVACLPAMSSFSDEAMSWFVLALERNANTTQAEGLARHSDIVEIDLTRGVLSIHGMQVPLSGTPLFYYGWYALKRLSGEGWITNPRSNRPDVSAGTEVAALLRRHGGHAKAISDLELHGLKARTLDQNRSKIKDGITAALGDKLAEKYLFAARKDPLTRRMSYRLNLPREYIEIKIAQGSGWFRSSKTSNR